MKTILKLAVLLCALTSVLRAGETKTLISGDAATDSLVLGDGESAKLVYANNRLAPPVNNTSPTPSSAYLLQLNVTKGGRTFALAAWEGPQDTRANAVAPVEIAGPATIKLTNLFTNDYPGLATFTVTRVGIAGEPAAIPIEPGSNFQVILESSSDLTNWSPANPGDYSGSEAKRFFRTRIVKKQ